MTRDSHITPLLAVFIVFSIHRLAGAAHPCDSIQGNFDGWLSSAAQTDVVIVGGGAAGLSAAKEFFVNSSTTSVILLEAQDYLGGRVKTYRQGSILVEDGAEWMNGGQINRLYKLAKQLGMFTTPIRSSDYDWRARTFDGKQGDPAGYDATRVVFMDCEKDAILKEYHEQGYGQCYIDRFDAAYKKSQSIASQHDAWLNYLHQWVNKDMGSTDWLDISGRDADHFTDWGADEWNQWTDGFDAVINYLAESIPANKIKKSSPVCKVFWDQPTGTNERVLLVTKSGQSYLASHVIFTGSVGHLKDRHLSLFDPPLPQEYQTALEGITLGIANKVQIGWATPWWGSLPLNLHIIFQQKTFPAEKSWLYGLMEMLTIHQQDSMLQGFMAGQNAIDMENLPEDTVKKHLLEHLKAITGVAIPEPTFFRRSRWMANPWMKGSYNSWITQAGDQAGLKSRAPLAKPLVNSNNKKVLYWAGEHHSVTRYGTVDGAMDTGDVTAYNVMLDNPVYF